MPRRQSTAAEAARQAAKYTEALRDTAQDQDRRERTAAHEARLADVAYELGRAAAPRGRGRYLLNCLRSPFYLSGNRRIPSPKRSLLRTFKC